MYTEHNAYGSDLIYLLQNMIKAIMNPVQFPHWKIYFEYDRSENYKMLHTFSGLCFATLRQQRHRI